MEIICSERKDNFNSDVDKYYSRQASEMTDFFRAFEAAFLQFEKCAYGSSLLYESLDSYRPISPFWDDFNKDVILDEMICDDERSKLCGFMNSSVIIPILDGKKFLHAEIYLIDCWPDERNDKYCFWIDTQNCLFWGKSKKMIGRDYFFIRRRISSELCEVLDSILSEHWDEKKDRKYDLENGEKVKTFYEVTLSDGYFIF